VAAVSLLLTATAAVTGALLVGTVPALAAAAVGAAGLAWVAARLLHAQLRDERLQHAEERVAQARAFSSLYLERSAEHALFASHIRHQLLGSERLVAQLRGVLTLAVARGDEAEDRAHVARARALDAEARVADLEAELAEMAGRRPELVDELAAWDVVPGVDADTVADLLSWEERATGVRVVEQRRRA